MIARDESQHLVLTQTIIKNWQNGDDPDITEIMKEEEDNVYEMYRQAVDEEKSWAEYLFKDGSMIGLNAKLLSSYVEYIANRRMRAIGLKPIFDTPMSNNPLPWTQHWLSSKRYAGCSSRDRSRKVIWLVVLNKTLRKIVSLDLNYDILDWFHPHVF